MYLCTHTHTHTFTCSYVNTIRFDHYAKRPDGSDSTYSSERILQRQFKYQLEIITYVYLGFGMQYSFLRKFGFTTLAIGLLAASIASQIGMLAMQVCLM